MKAKRCLSQHAGRATPLFKPARRRSEVNNVVGRGEAPFHDGNDRSFKPRYWLALYCNLPCLVTLLVPNSKAGLNASCSMRYEDFPKYHDIVEICHNSDSLEEAVS